MSSRLALSNYINSNGHSSNAREGHAKGMGNSQSRDTKISGNNNNKSFHLLLPIFTFSVLFKYTFYYLSTFV